MRHGERKRGKEESTSIKKGGRGGKGGEGGREEREQGRRGGTRGEGGPLNFLKDDGNSFNDEGLRRNRNGDELDVSEERR